MAKVRLRYWAALRAAAQAAEQEVVADTLAEALAVAKKSHGDRFAAVLGMCAVLVDETPVGALDHTEVPLRDGAVVDLLPPFAGG